MNTNQAEGAFRFVHNFRVRFSEIDAQAVVHNSQYLIYFEIGRVEYLRNVTLDFTELFQQGYNFLLVLSHVEYCTPARFDQLLQLQLRIDWIKNSSFQFGYRLTDQATGKLIAHGYTIHVVLDRAKQTPCPFPDDMKKKFVSFEGRQLKPPPT